MSDSDRNEAAWPARFTIGYVARRAGMSHYRMRSWMLDFPALAALMRPGRWTYLTLNDLRQLAPGMFDALVLHIRSEEEEEAEAA